MLLETASRWVNEGTRSNDDPISVKPNESGVSLVDAALLVNVSTSVPC
jgi:hypothetical protein